MTTDTTERGLETLISDWLTRARGSKLPSGVTRERPANYSVGWVLGDWRDYDREFCVDLDKLSVFLRHAQRDVAEPLDLGNHSPTRRRFLPRLQGQITKRGTIDVLRNRIRHDPHHIDLTYGTPSPGNRKARDLYSKNHFSVTRQLRYSRDEILLALDLGCSLMSH